MADVRALLKAKRLEARVTHPLAAYNQAGQLRCIVCGIAVRHASAWEGHIGGGTHRANVTRRKEEERRREEESAAVEEERVAGTGVAVTAVGKRKIEEEPQGESKKLKTHEGLRGRFPADFFSDPSRAPVFTAKDNETNADLPTTSGAQAKAGSTSVVDEEYARFQLELVDHEAHRRETYERATVFAEERIAPNALEGFPIAAESNSPTETLMQETADRERRAREDGELFIDRLLEEETAQEDVDMRVQLMRERVQSCKEKLKGARMMRRKQPQQ